MTETAEAGAEAQADAVVRGGLPWPAWVLGLTGAIAAILYVFVD
jgi:hypothetical protein